LKVVVICGRFPLIVDIEAAYTTEYPMFFPIYAWVTWDNRTITGITAV